MFKCSDSLTFYQCTFCKFATNEKTSKLVHSCNNNELKEVKLFECEQCGLESYSAFCNFVHQILCLTGSKFKKCTNNTVLTQTAKNLQLKCIQCDYKACNKYQLKKHIVSKHVSDNLIEWHKCGQCNYKAKHIESLKNHIASKHSNAKKFKCQHCKFETHLRRNLNHHMRFQHTPDDLIKWKKCGQCDYKSKYACHIKQHLLTKHLPNTQMKYRCDDCPFQTPLLEKFNLHQIKQHTPEALIKWYDCNICNFKTKHHPYLRRHVALAHLTTEKRFKCGQCDFATKRRQDLKMHVSRVHNLDREFFRCKECSFKTNTKWYLKNHMICKHAPDHQIEWICCNLCNFKFKLKSSFHKHFRKYHKA